MNKKDYSPKVIVETAMMFAIIFLIIMMTSVIPTFSYVGMFILPIPIVLLYIRHNCKIAVVAVIISMLLTSFLYNPISALVSGIMYGLTGLSLGYCIKSGKKSSFSIIIVSISIIIVDIIRFIIYSVLINKQGIREYINLFVKQFKEPFIEVKNMYVETNVPQETIEILDKLINYITIENIIIMIPIVIITSSVIQAYVNYLITQKVLKRMNYKVKEIVPFSRIYVPNRFLALLIIIACIGTILSSKGIRGTYYLSVIGQMIVVLTLCIDGMSYFTYFLRKRLKISKGITALIIMVFLFIPIFSNVYLIMGFMDILLNLRKLDKNPIKKIKPRE